MKLLSLLILTLTAITAHAQIEVGRWVLQPGQQITNIVVQQYVKVRPLSMGTLGSGVGMQVSCRVNGQEVGAWGYQTTWAPSQKYNPEECFVGPCELRLANTGTGANMIVLQFENTHYPPGKTAVVIERDGPMKCTLEESTDLRGK